MHAALLFFTLHMLPDVKKSDMDCGFVNSVKRSRATSDTSSTLTS